MSDLIAWSTFTKKKGLLMTALERQEEALINRVRGTLETGKAVAVLGWMKSNHDKFTRRVQKTGKVTFYEKTPDRLGTSVGFGIFRLGSTHSDFERLSVRTDCHPTVLSHGDIKRVLKAACQQVRHLVPVVTEEKVSSVVVPEPIVVIPTPKLEVSTEKVQTAPEENKMQEDVAGFIVAFMKEADKNGGLVGKNVLGDIRRAHGIKHSNANLVKAGRIVAVISQGRTKAGKYKASEKMRKEAGQLPEVATVVASDDPFTQARAFIARGPALEEQILQLQIQLEELQKKLDQVTSAKELLKKLTDLTT